MKDPNTDIETKLNGIYNVSSRNGVPFLNITWENNQKEAFLMLSNELFCFLYNNDSFPYITGFHGSTPMAGENFLLSPDGIRASSYLIENGKAYLPNNLNSEVGKAWVEGVEGQGIHEKLFIRQSGISAIHISLGFVRLELSREEALKRFAGEPFKTELINDLPPMLGSIKWRRKGQKEKKLYDLSEAPGAYKDIDTVIQAESDLVKPLVRLSPLAVVKG
jgi:hypothetical protein